MENKNTGKVVRETFEKIFSEIESLPDVKVKNVLTLMLTELFLQGKAVDALLADNVYCSDEMEKIAQERNI